MQVCFVLVGGDRNKNKKSNFQDESETAFMMY